MNAHIGELTALLTAMLWTVSALVSERASRRHGDAVVNVYRMALAMPLLFAILLFMDGASILGQAGVAAWAWMMLSGLVGYTFGDFCLYNSYILIGSRFAQLFMTLAPPSAALAAYVFLGESLKLKAMLGMALTMFGIAMSVFSKASSASPRLTLKLPLRGVMFAVGAAVGQGLGLVISKVGMSQFSPSVASHHAVPVAATLMRGASGLAGFIVMLYARRMQAGMRRGAESMPLLISVAIFGHVLGVTLSLRAVQLADVGIAQTIMATTPVLILIPSVLVFHQTVRPKEVLGAIISVCGVALFFL